MHPDRIAAANRWDVTLSRLVRVVKQWRREIRYKYVTVLEDGGKHHRAKQAPADNIRTERFSQVPVA